MVQVLKAQGMQEPHSHVALYDRSSDGQLCATVSRNFHGRPVITGFWLLTVGY